ncbi:hypothetical protein ACT3CD_02490 [Geofilum sp. OHC36d9]|uniref:hypothetical protein n=1 Tax=Geofilum sp. OHC36d9 TaxID=3458413 RepID=UPI0040338C81
MRYKILFLLWGVFLFTVKAVDPPRLIVVLVVDELNNDLLNQLQPDFSQNGFNAIARSGFRYMSMVSTEWSGYPGTRMAGLFSGTTSARHGIIGEKWFDYRKYEFTRPLTGDSSSLIKHIYYRDAKSLSDYLKSYYGYSSQAVGFSLNQPWMIQSLGYSPDAFYSFDLQRGVFFNALNPSDTTAAWCNDFNRKIMPQNLLNQPWEPVKELIHYQAYKNRNPQADSRTFFYSMKNGTTLPFERVPGSPRGNMLLRDAVVSFLAATDMGKDEIPDLLTIGFSIRPFVTAPAVSLSVEKEDMLLRLDKDVASLVDFLDVEIGNKNYLLVVTSAMNPSVDRINSGKEAENTGWVNCNKMESLLNLYLMAHYGQGKWVLGISDHNIFLNRRLIAENNLSLKTVEEKSALFLLEMSGIERAVPTYDMLLSPPLSEPFVSNYFPMRSGDLLFSLRPGWQTKPSVWGTTQLAESSAVKVPVLVDGWITSEGISIEPTDLSDLVPLILNQMNIDFPAVPEDDGSAGLFPAVKSKPLFP